VGVGGRRWGGAGGGLRGRAAFAPPAGDPATEVVVVIGKPPAPSVRRAVEARLRALGKPSVIALLGPDVETGQRGAMTAVGKLEGTAHAPRGALGRGSWPPPPSSPPSAEVRARIAALRSQLAERQSAVHGLYAGGTLAHEAALILAPLLGAVASDGAPTSARHRVVDLGADEHTIGR